MIKVTNKHKPDLWPTAIVYIGRPSPLGNPFRIGPDGTRDDVIAKYEAWIAKPTNEAMTELWRIKHLEKSGELVALECWCAPLPCHGDVIKRVLESWQ